MPKQHGMCIKEAAWWDGILEAFSVEAAIDRTVHPLPLCLIHPPSGEWSGEFGRNHLENLALRSVGEAAGPREWVSGLKAYRDRRGTNVTGCQRITAVAM